MKEFLFSEKKIYDSLHGFIQLDEFEKELVDSYPYQRLHYIHQLGIAFLVYPGATHTRFEHSLGVMEVASRIFDRLCKTIRPDVFHLVPRKGSSEYIYWKAVLRLSALCHDLGHLPFSHAAEEDFMKEGHEIWTAKVIQSKYFMPLWDKIKKVPSYNLPGRDLVEDIIKISIGEKKWQLLDRSPFSNWEKIVSEIITGDFFGADRIDYLLRDAKRTGVSYGLFDYKQLIEMLRILPSLSKKGSELSLGIDENGIESCEALLLARHFMHRRVYQYSAVQAYNFHLRRFMQKTYDPSNFKNIDDFLLMSDMDVLVEMKKAAFNSSSPGFEDAKAIIQRKGRFKAFFIPNKISTEQLKELQIKNKIPSSQMAWETQKHTYPDRLLSFPVARRALVLQKASDCSELLFKVFPTQNTWIYISPEYELQILDVLEKWRS